ncbi:hypothetical protein M378DRAFT_199989 [Amanita muscaria Koide BX008]|uniref:Uncharacterized protein n=1 Tax=Amanita muscaria (strain Koide BX008) TaxID=946122 RepID=A0A0C2WT16_AMAMK|nr:hypothetical protein M378DRAFT_199989 [Amanita muscaria Koide BX008]
MVLFPILQPCMLGKTHCLASMVAHVTLSCPISLCRIYFLVLSSLSLILKSLLCSLIPRAKKVLSCPSVSGTSFESSARTRLPEQGHA